MKSDLIVSEAKKWVNENIIDSSQARKICNKYGADFDNPEQKTKGYNALVVLGYLFVGIALIILISENWDDIPHMLKTSVLIGSTFAINAIAALKYNTQANKATALFFLGGLVYGASIILIAQIYHLGEHMPDGIWYWAIGVLPFAFFSKNNYLMALALALISLWFYIEWVEFDQYQSIYLLFILSSIYALYNYNKNTTLFVLTSSALFVFLLITIIHFYTNGYFGYSWLSVFPLLLMFHAFSYILENSKSKKINNYARLLKILSVLVASFNLIFLTYAESWQDSVFVSVSIQFNQLSFYVDSLIMLISVLILSYFKQFSIAIFWAVLFILSYTLEVFVNQDIYMQVIYNLVFVVFSIGLIVTGVKKPTSHYFFLGMVNILLLAFMRYIDLVGDYIGTSVLFIVLAVVLLISAKYWVKLND